MMYRMSDIILYYTGILTIYVGYVYIYIIYIYIVTCTFLKNKT